MYFKTHENLIPFKKIRAFSLSGQIDLFRTFFLQRYNIQQTDAVIIHEISFF
jgi:hypothetical protein